MRIFRGESDVSISIRKNGNLNRTLYEINNKNTFVFILDSIYDNLSPSVKKESKTVSFKKNDLTVDEMMNEEILYVIMSEYDLEEIKSTVKLIELYSKKKLSYLIIK